MAADTRRRPSEPVVGATATNAASEGTASGTRSQACFQATLARARTTRGSFIDPTAAGQSAAGSAAAGESAAEETANEFLKIESAEWINALTSRFWYNFRYTH